MATTEGNAIVANSHLTNIATAIRDLAGTTEEITVQEMAAKIAAANLYSGYITVEGSRKLGWDKTMTWVTAGAFTSCGTTVNGIYLPSVTRIEQSAFEGQSSLSSIDIPKVATIQSYAFLGVSATTINCPICTTIAEYAFQYSSLASGYFPKATSIGSSAFDFCSDLTYLDLSSMTMTTVANKASTWAIQEGVTVLCSDGTLIIGEDNSDDMVP